jgi:hypothetical protein
VKDVKTDDSFLREMLQAGEHLLRDLASVSGINPFLSPEQFTTLATIAQHFSISKSFLADALTINAPELLSGTIGLVASLLMGNKADPSRLSMLSGGYLVSSLAYGNPILLPVAVGGIIYAYGHTDNKRALFLQAGKGAIVRWRFTSRFFSGRACLVKLLGCCRCCNFAPLCHRTSREVLSENERINDPCFNIASQSFITNELEVYI